MSDHRPKKHLGQHFLHDRRVIEKIIRCIPPAEERTEERIIVEIGPGLGALTRPLLATGARLEVIEIDRALTARLRREWPAHPSLRIHEADALRFDFSRYGAREVFVIGNLPYNISTPVIFHLLDARERIAGMLFMLQKEVAQRVCATGGRRYGRLSVMIQAHCEVKRMFDVRPGAFSPAPAVASSVVLIVPARETARPRPADPSRFAAVVRAAFGQRRKQIGNALAGFADRPRLARLGVSPQRRAEQVSVDDYIRIANDLPAAPPD